MGIVRIGQLDGRLPNLALMKLAAWHRARGDEVRFYKGAAAAERHLDEPAYDAVYGSAIFKFSAPLIERFRIQFPDAILGGTGTDNPGTVEQIVGEDFEQYDYSIAPDDFRASLGFTQRGCRLKCKFCLVPQLEGKPRVSNTIADIWRGPGFPKHIHLLDNDFFAIESHWRARIAEIREGGFKVSFNQGLNVRLITEDGAKALATVEYRDDGFKKRRLHTAWDNLKDEQIFFRGVRILQDAGIPPSHLMAYMLVGFDKNETWERLFFRFERMKALGIRPYPMIYGEKRRLVPLGGSNMRIGHKTLGDFQRWVNTGLYRAVSFEEYDVNKKGRSSRDQGDLFGPTEE